MTAGAPGAGRRRLVTAVMVVAAAACYVGIIAVRHGPPPGGDTVPLTAVTTDLSHGDLGAAASDASLPNPPGYALLTAPLVVLFRSWVGSPTWCITPSRQAGLRPAGQRAVSAGPDQCGADLRLPDGTLVVPPPPWERSQGVLGLLSWLVLALACLSLLRAAGADSVGRQAGLLVFLAFLPAASSAIVQLFHPQDIVSLGLAVAGLAQTLRRRWVVAGVLFGAAFLTKQFAVLLLLPALVAAPGVRPRLQLAGAAAVVFAAGILPFLVAAPRATIANLDGFSAGGAVAGSTVLSLAGATGSVASAVARDAPVAFAVVVCLWAGHRFGDRLGAPVALVALGLTCVGSRLVFESVIFPYYLLAASVLFVLLDLVARRTPHRSLAWCAAAAFFVAVRPANHAVDAVGTLVLAVAAVAAGLVDLLGLEGAGADPAVGHRRSGEPAATPTE